MVDLKKVKWQPVKHFVDGKEIPGAPKALIPQLGGWVIIMPNYWNGFVVVPEPTDPKLKIEMESFNEIQWETTYIPIPEPDGTGDYGVPPGDWKPKGKRGLLPAGELIYINQRTVFISK
jgi:hypothetical protein